MDHVPAPPRQVLTRRQCLAAFAALSGGVALPSACSQGPAYDGPVTPVAGDLDVPGVPPAQVPLASVPDGGRLEVPWGQIQVELRRRGTTVEARAMLCSHQGCRVLWKPDGRYYQCACHEGRFDESGRPIAGIPTQPLHRVPLLVSPTSIYVGARPRA